MTTAARSHAPTRLARRLAALSLVGMVGLSGCQALSPMETTRDYAPANGELVRAGDVSILDLHVLATEPDSEGRVIGALTNSSTEPQEVSLAVDGKEAWSGTVGPKERLNLADEDVTIPKSAAPGAFQKMKVSAGGQDTDQSVPVLLPVGEYEEYAPEGWEAPERPTKKESGGAHH
ncbi:hypothetical protein [Kytococcus sp. Marseille-QA3725]